MKLYKKIAWGLLAALVVIQFFRIDKTNPPYDSKNDFISLTNPPENVKSLLKAACYDCHSNESIYPWYTNIAPISFWIKGHINNGRKHLNFSEWGTYNDNRKDHKMEECVEYVGEAWMPLSSYTWVHSDARLSDEDRNRLVTYFESLRKN